MARARTRGITTAFAVRGFGYYEPRYFENVDHAFTCSRFLTEFYRDMVGLVSTPLEPPIDWASVLAPVESRAFVTFVNPSPHKGLLLFARLADMLGSRRPDIPILVVQSGDSGGSLNAIPGIDFSRYPQIMAAPPVPTAGRLLRADAPARRPVGVGRTVRPRRRRGDDQRASRRSSATAARCRTSSAATPATAAADASCRFPSGCRPTTTRAARARKTSSRGTTPSARSGTIPRCIASIAHAGAADRGRAVQRDASRARPMSITSRR